MSRSEILPKMIQNFQDMGWPTSVMVLGKQGKDKKKLIFNVIKKELYKKRFHSSQSLESVEYLLDQRQHPDCYIFSDANVKIGDDNSSAKPGTIRHLLRHFIGYSPKEGKIRFVIFENAARIGDQAESALLKILEEPPKNTHFILFVENSYDLKDTIHSRCLAIPFLKKYDPKDIPRDPWERFWYFSGQIGSEEYELINRTNWKSHIQNTYDHLHYSNKDFLTFDEIGIAAIKKNFNKINLEIQNKILVLNFLPLYFSLRDLIMKGKLPTIGPVSLPNMQLTHNYAALLNLRRFISLLKKKYFETRPVSPVTTYYEFLSKFMKYWIFVSTSTIV